MEYSPESRTYPSLLTPIPILTDPAIPHEYSCKTAEMKMICSKRFD